MTTENSFSGMDENRLRLAAQAAARRFKNTWIEFGAVLIQVRDTEAWRSWGFESFESYCSLELHIRHKTAQKLTASYGFLQRHEPQVAASEMRAPLSLLPQDFSRELCSTDSSEALHLAPEEVDDESQTLSQHQRGKKVPAFETISVLAGAEARGQLNDEDYAALRERIWGPTSGSDDRALAKEIKERFSEKKPQKTDGVRLHKCAQVARKLADELLALSLADDDLKSQAEALAQRLEEASARQKEAIGPENFAQAG